jgi:2-hydroxychromene-2-carboxylate isomerase
MTKSVDYYLSPSSPWAYLGHARFVAAAPRHAATITIKPVDYRRIFPATGGLPLAQRPKARQAYRLMELRRWREHLGIELNLQPKFTPVATEPAARLIIAADRGGFDAVALAGAIMRAVWVEERNIADPATLKEIAASQGHDGDALVAKSGAADIEAAYRAYTDEALAAGVFGAPTYVYKGELFWGQDRIDFLDRALGR